MPQQACFQELFQLNTPVFASLKNIPVNLVTSYNVPNTGRPFVPIVGCLRNTDGIFIPDTIANNRTFVQAFVEMFISCRQASINFYNDLVGTASLVSDNYAGYLAKKTIVITQAQERYMQIIGIVKNFWDNADPAWTDDVYNAKLQELFNTVSIQADKTLYIPPAAYHFEDADPFSVVIDAWATAEPLFAGFLAVEYYQ